MRLVFMGSDPIALPLLEWLAGEGGALAEIIAVYTQPDRPAGRGQKVEAGPIRRWAAARQLPVRQPEKLAPDERVWLAAQQADVALVMAYGQILKDDFIATPRLGTLNLHASILPKHRGASPVQTAIACGDPETGVTLMRVVRKLDAGPVADVERVPIAPLETAAEVERKLAAACVPLLARTLPRLRAGTLEFSVQNDQAATYCRRMVKEDGRLDFAAPAAALAARINGLFPWPGCVAEINGVVVKLGLADGDLVWMETKKGERFSDILVEQAVELGAEVLATACPYCILNFKDSVLTMGREDRLEVRDVSEIVAEVM